MAISTKDRSAAYRKRRSAGVNQAIQFTLPKTIIETLDKFIGIAGNSRSEVVSNALISWACDAVEALPKLQEYEAKRKEKLLNQLKENENA
ncbi:hypothetical protein [Methylobacter sp. S3L5C]|uniref:hypothetical protein n=1 Tax=Methylobacter sp. S3L5C TaxID=2839024 RepID=UPI001FACE50D|nr:hypothetical protein [Methylobacter sp. S3L5C]UOA09182.1 hypothetical protein KKZ03_02365 [Methylobacter sp. S3L5C]